MLCGVMAHLLVPVSSVADAERAAADGASIVDTGEDEALAAAIAAAGLDVLICGPGADADRIRAAAVDVDDPAGDPARSVALAAVHAWQGARVVRTRHVVAVRRGLDMTASIAGLRPPAFAVRGLA